MTSSRRRFLTRGAAGSAALLAGVAGGAASLSGCLGLGGGGDGAGGEIPTGTPESTPTGPVASLSPPDDAGSRTYAYAGNPDAPTVTYFGNWKCPHCATFSTGFMQDIARDYVATGRIGFEFRAIVYLSNGQPFLGADAVRAGHAGLAAWNVDAASYWPYHHHVFANQPSGREWATTDQLTQFAWDAGVSNLEQFRSQVADGAYENALRQTATVAFDQHGVRGTPSLLIDGQVINPLGNEQAVRNRLDQLAQG